MRLLPLVLLAAAWPARAADLPPDLACVPHDAIGVVHVRAAELWTSDLFTPYREAFLKAGPRALGVLDTRFPLALSSVERLTTVVLTPGDGPEPSVGLVVRTNKPFDGAKLAVGFFPDAKQQTSRDGIRFYFDERSRLAFRAFDERTFVIGTPDVPARLSRGQPDIKHPFQAILEEAAAGKKAVVAAANTGIFAEKALAQDLPPQLEPLKPLLKAKMVTASMAVGQEVAVEVRLNYADAAAAADAEKAVDAAKALAKQGLAQARNEMEKRLYEPADPKRASQMTEMPEAVALVFGLGAIKQAEEQIANLPLKKEGNDLALAAKLPPGLYSGGAIAAPIAVGLLLPAVQKTREAAARMKDQNNLKQIGLAFHNTEAAYGNMSPAILHPATKKPLLSWRVHLLPYLEQEQLYRQFKIDEPWDSDHNKKLLPMMPKIYQMNGDPKPSNSETYLRTFVGRTKTGNAWFMDLQSNVRFPQITDGLSNTLLVVESGEAVPWTKPEGLEFADDKPLPKMNPFRSGGFNALFGDGSVQFLSNTTDEKVLRALITRDGGEVVQRP